MKFSIGYNPILPFQSYQKYLTEDKISEIYFSMINTPSGHDMSIYEKCGNDLSKNLVKTLQEFKKNGKKLNLLLNASCYGKMEGTVEQDEYVDRILNSLAQNGLCPDIITAVSPYIARMFKEKHPNVEVRMSVLSCISSIHSMTLASNVFDSFYINQDLNRNIKTVKEISNWCKCNRKKLCLVVNSGCIGNCPYKMNHGNMSSHCHEQSHHTQIPCANIYDNTYADRNLAFLQGNWIRPEDLHNYSDIIDIAKLDTRLAYNNFNGIIDSYVQEKCNGNLFDVMSQTSPYHLEIDNSKFPIDYFEKIKNCTKRCDICNYCQSISEIFS